MKRLFMYLFLAAGISLVFMGCSDKNSLEACRHKVTQDLDKGNYDAVLESACASSLQKGAANFGKAGFDIKDVVNRLIDAGVGSSQTSTNDNDLTVYMNSLIGNVTPTSLAYIDKASEEYELVCESTPTWEPAWKDANFYESVVDSMKALSLLKTVVDSEGLGKMSTCDSNGNNVPDEVDATACSLIASSNIVWGMSAPCTRASYAPLAPADMTLYYDQARQNPVEGTYSGLIITVEGAPAAGCPSAYKRLLYKSQTGKHWVATTADKCFDSAGQDWPCPLAGANVDLVATIDQSLSGAISSLNNATSGAEKSDVIEAIEEIRDKACPNGTCTNESIAAYLQTIKK